MAGAGRMDPLEQLAVGGLEAEQIAVRAGLPPEGQFVALPLAQAQGHRQRRLGLDAADDVGHPLGGDARILAGLQHDGAVAEGHAFPDAGHDLVGRHAVAGQFAIIDPQPAVAAEADAVVRDFDQAPQVHFSPDRLLPDQIRAAPKILQPGLAGFAKPGDDLGSLHGGERRFPSFDYILSTAVEGMTGTNGMAKHEALNGEWQDPMTISDMTKARHASNFFVTASVRRVAAGVHSVCSDCYSLPPTFLMRSTVRQE